METMSYLKSFQTLEPHRKDLLTLTGDCLLVEIIKDEDLKKTKSGIYLGESKNQIVGVYSDKPRFCRVLMVGEGFYNEDTKDTVPCETKPGDIILVGNHSIKRFSCFGNLIPLAETELGMTRESDIQMRFLGEQAATRVFELLNSVL